MKARWLILLLLLAAAAGAYAHSRISSQRDADAPPLPPEVVTVEVVPQATLDRIAGLEADMAAERGKPPKLVQRVEWRTREVPVEIPGPLRTEIRRVMAPCEETTNSALTDIGLVGRIDVAASQFVGSVDGGEVRFGWRGRASCLVRLDAGGWHTLLEAPLDLQESRALTSLDPRLALRSLGPRVATRLGVTSDPGILVGASWWRSERRWGLFLEATWVPSPGSTDRLRELDYQTWAATSSSLAAFRVAGGIERRWGRP